MRIFIFMKARLNITIEEALLSSIKSYAASKDMSISEMVEGYFRDLIKPEVRSNNILDLVEQLETPLGISQEMDLKKSFYEDNSAKYGF